MSRFRDTTLLPYSTSNYYQRTRSYLTRRTLAQNIPMHSFIEFLHFIQIEGIASYILVSYSIDLWIWAGPTLRSIFLDICYDLLIYLVSFAVCYAILTLLGRSTRFRLPIARWSRSRWQSTYASKSPFELLAFVQLYLYVHQQLLRIYAFYRRITTSQYIYKPLDGDARNIRLIKLLPGIGDDPLSAWIMTIPLDEASGKFEALSYAWEGDTKYYDLVTDEGTILLTRSLYSALRRFRLRHEVRVLWADAVCINQGNNLEKGKQVAFMSDIYALAMRTLVFLGEAANESDTALDLLEKIAATDIPQGIDSKHLHPDAIYLSGLPPDGDPAWVAVRKFWGRPWFRRVWVIQEFVRSLDVLMVCGSWEGDWMIFHSAIRKHGLFWRSSPTLYNALECQAMEAGVSAMAIMTDIRSRCLAMTLESIALDGLFTALGSENYQGILPGQTGLPSLWGIASSPVMISPLHQTWLNQCRKNLPCLRMGGSFPLLKLLSLCERSEATRARDHLFAVLGLADDAQDELFSPDYAIPFEEVARRYGRAFVRNGKCMDLLYECRLGSQPYRFPSWIPDWTTKYVALRIDGARESLGSVALGLYCAAGNTRIHASLDESKDSLIVRGGFVDKIIWVGSLPTSTVLDVVAGNSAKSLSRAHGNLWPLYLIHEAYKIIKLFPFYPTREPLEEVFWRTLIANKTREGAKATYGFGAPLRKLFENMDAVLETMESLSPQAVMEALIEVIGQAYYDSLLTIFPSYRLAFTQNLYFGLVPLLAEAGDHICVLNGGAVPFVLMERKNPNTGHRLIGECYIHGIMNGETLMRKSWKEEEITIS